MADNNIPVAEPAAVEAVNAAPVENNEREERGENRNEERNDDRNEERGDREDRGERGRNNRDREDRGAGRLQGPTDLMPELEPQGDDERKEIENGRAYEISYIVTAGNDEAVNATQERLKAMIEGAQGAVDHARVSESRRLAFPIKKQTEGVYVVINARFPQTLIEELDRFFKLEDSVLRHIILREGR